MVSVSMTVTPTLVYVCVCVQESKVRFDEDKDFQGRAYSYVVRLQNYDPEVVQAWQLICNISRLGKRLLVKDGI